MKKYLHLIPLLLLCNSTIFAQSVKFGDLVYFASLTNDEIHNNLMQGNAFRQDYIEQLNGQQLEYFKNVSGKPNSEKIIVGAYTKLYDGTVLRTVDYTSTNSQNIIGMISQAKRYGLALRFRGVDKANNIYLYDNELYNVSIYLRRDQSSGLVEIKQKEFLGLE